MSQESCPKAEESRSDWQERRDAAYKAFEEEDANRMKALAIKLHNPTVGPCSRKQTYQKGYDQGRVDANVDYDALHKEAGEEVMRLHNLAASFAIKIAEMKESMKELVEVLQSSASTTCPICGSSGYNQHAESCSLTLALLKWRKKTEDTPMEYGMQEDEA